MERKTVRRAGRAITIPAAISYSDSAVGDMAKVHQKLQILPSPSAKTPGMIFKFSGLTPTGNQMRIAFVRDTVKMFTAKNLVRDHVERFAHDLSDDLKAQILGEADE